MAQLGRAEAIAKIRALAEAGCVGMHKRAQERMEALNYDITDVEECLCALSPNDCTRDGAPEHQEFGRDAWVYEFVTVFGSDRLYVKLYLYADRLYVLSFKLDGSPA